MIILYLLLINKNTENFGPLPDQYINININSGGGINNNIIVPHNGTFFITVGSNYNDINIIITFVLIVTDNGSVVSRINLPTGTSNSFKILIMPLQNKLKGANVSGEYDPVYNNFLVTKLLLISGD